MTKVVVSIDELADAVNNALVEYTETITQGITTAGLNAAKACRAALRTTSPKDRGDYAKSWAISKVKGRPGEPMKYIIHNKQHYRLTHLLEYGHLVKRDGKVIGRAAAHPHIAKAETETVTKYLNDVEAIIREDS